MVLLFVRKTTGQVLAVDVDMNASVSQLKETITLVEGVESDRQTLIFAGRVLKDGASLSSYNISKECSIQLFTSAVRERSRAPSEVDELLVGSGASFLTIAARCVSALFVCSVAQGRCSGRCKGRYGTCKIRK